MLNPGRLYCLRLWCCYFFISKYWMQNEMDFFLFLKFNLFRLITTMIVDWLACYLSALPASEVGHDYFELSLRFVVWVPKRSSKSRSHDCASLQGGGGGGSTSVTAVAVERLLVRTPPWFYCLDSWFNQYSFTACFFHLFVCLFFGCILSPPPPPLESHFKQNKCHYIVNTSGFFWRKKIIKHLKIK